MSFFDDDAAPPEPEPRPRSRRSRSRTRTQRIVVLGVLLFVIVLGLTWWLRDCQQDRKVSSYRNYFTQVSTMIEDSNKVGKALTKILQNPTPYSNSEFKAELNKLRATHAEILARAEGVTPPDSLEDEHTTFVRGMRLRTQGIALLRQAMVSALNVKDKTVTAGKLGALSGYFTGPDVYYQQYFYVPAQNAMKDDGVSDVAVPRSDYYQSANFLDRAMAYNFLRQVQGSTRLKGIHGVALVSTVVKPENVKLVPNKKVPVKAAAELIFAVTVQNQGTVGETDVPVVVTLVPPGEGGEQKLQAKIASIAPDQKQTIDVSGFTIPATAISRTSLIKVVVGPVPEEQVTTNNKAEYQILLRLP